MDAGCLKIRNTLHQRKFHLNLGDFEITTGYEPPVSLYDPVFRVSLPDTLLTVHPLPVSVLDTQEVSPRRLQGITEVMLVQLRLIEAMLKDTLVAYFTPRTPGTFLHPYRSRYKDTYRISPSSFCYSFTTISYAITLLSEFKLNKN